MHHGHASLKRLLLTQLAFDHHLNAIYSQVIQPLASDLKIRCRIYPKSIFANLLSIASCCRRLNSSFQKISSQSEPDTFEIDAELCIKLYAEYVDILIESIKNWVSCGLPKLVSMWSHQRVDTSVRQTLSHIACIDARWVSMQKGLNWKDKSQRLDIFSTSTLPVSFTSELIKRVDELLAYVNQKVSAFRLAVIVRDKLQGLERFLNHQPGVQENLRQIDILAIEYLIVDCPSLQNGRLRKYEKSASFEMIDSTEEENSTKVLLFAFNDILIWASTESRAFLGGAHRADSSSSEDSLANDTISLEVGPGKVFKFRSSEKQQHKEWMQYLTKKSDKTRPIKQARRHSLLNKYPAMTLHVDVRLYSLSKDALLLKDEILMHDGDHVSKLAHLFVRRHRLGRSVANELRSRLETAASACCKDIRARRKLYLGYLQ